MPVEESGARPADSRQPEERPRKRRKKSKRRQARPILFWGLIAGGLAFVAGMVVLVVILVAGQAASNLLLTGEWESTEGGRKYVIEFTALGKIYPRGDFGPFTEFQFAKPLKMFADFGLQTGRGLDINYRCLSDNRLEIRADYTALLEKLSAGMEKGTPTGIPKGFTPTETLSYTVTEKELTLTDDEGKSIHLLRRGG
jgi:hypothetical protein